MTDEEARAEFSKMTAEELRALAKSNNIPEQGLADSELIDALLGLCPKCKGGKMTVVYNGVIHTDTFKETAPCVGCNKNK